MKELETLILDWSRQRGILEHSTKQAQTLKAVSEMGELADAIIKGNHNDTVDAIGDVIVCLINVAYMQGTGLTECLSRAYDEIKDRKGSMSADGAWVKE